MRLSAPELAARYRDGLLGEGANVIDAGQVGSEMLYFLVGSRELDGGLMCTASHNPKAYTGAKLVREGAIALSGDSGIQDIRRRGRSRATRARRRTRPTARAARVEQVDLYEEFQAAALRLHRRRRRALGAAPLKVVVDGGNGMAGPMVGPLLERLGARADRDLLDARRQLPRPRAQPAAAGEPQADHREGARRPAPTSASPGTATPTAASSSTTPARSSTATSSPRCWPSRCSRKHPGEAILYDVRASRAVPDTVTRAGGTPYVNRVGHAFFKTRMRKEGSLFGGEVSGHYYFRDFYCADSGTIPALLMLELLRASGKRMSELLAPYRASATSSPARSTPKSRTRTAKMEEIAARYADARQERLDGISIDYEDWHFNVRSSNTEPLLRLCLESLVSPRGHGAPPRRGARADPRRLVTPGTSVAASAEEPLKRS